MAFRTVQEGVKTQIFSAC